MRLIEVDGIYLDGNTYLQTLRLNPGQRYSILIQGKQNSSLNYWISATIHPFPNYQNQFNYSIQPTVLAILQYNDQNNIPSSDFINENQYFINQSLIDGEIFTDQTNLFIMNSSKYVLPNDENVQTFIFNSQFKGYKPGHFYFNNETFIHPINQSLLSLILSNQYQSLSSFIQIENNQIIDLIINNIDYSSHPFHLHGHHVWILKQGNTNDGYLNQSIHYNITTNTIYRDTFTVNPFSHIIIRFKANNPGIWMMHCHNDWHLQLGMALVFIESKQLIQQFYSNQYFINSIPSTCQHH
jgi:iron transport multicopper oxidase